MYCIIQVGLDTRLTWNKHANTVCTVPHFLFPSRNKKDMCQTQPVTETYNLRFVILLSFKKQKTTIYNPEISFGSTIINTKEGLICRFWITGLQCIYIIYGEKILFSHLWSAKDLIFVYRVSTLNGQLFKKIQCITQQTMKKNLMRFL